MSEKPYETAHVDELEALPVDDEGLVWRPVRRHFGIEAFGVNAYTATSAGDRVVEEHTEAQNEHEELYFVARGRARFTLDEETVDAPAGTFVFASPGVKRGAVAEEAGTLILGMGGKRGEAFAVSGWETSFAAYGYHRKGETERGVQLLREAVEREPGSWQGHYHLACLSALAGHREDALEHLASAVELDGEASRWASDDDDFAAVREEPRFRELVREPAAP